MSSQRHTSDIQEYEALLAAHAEIPTRESWSAVEELLDHYPRMRTDWRRVYEMHTRYLAFVRESLTDAAIAGDTESQLTLSLMALCGYPADRSDLQEGMLFQRLNELIFTRYGQDISVQDVQRHFVDNGPQKNLRTGITKILKVGGAGHRKAAALQRVAFIAKRGNASAQILALHLFGLGRIQRVESYGLSVEVLVKWGIKFAELHFNEPRTNLG